MAIYHLTVKISSGVCDSMAYGLRTQITDITTEEQHDRRGKGLKLWGVELCRNAPEEWEDPQELCNAIVEAEKQKDAQQCRTFEGSLPVGERITDADREILVRQFVEKLTKQGMCVAWAIHEPDGQNSNPHFHAYATLRSVDKDGHFMAKCKKVYEMEQTRDEEGNPIFDDKHKPVMKKVAIYDKNGNIKTDKAGRKQYKSKREDTNDWNKTETLKKWRKDFEVIQNNLFKYKGIDARVSCETLEKQGIDRIPQIHIPRKSWELMRQGKSDAFIERYKQIQEMNEAKAKEQAINTEIESLEEEIKTLDQEIEQKTKAPISVNTPEKMPKETAKTAKMAYDLFGVGEKPTENAQISEDIKKDDIVVAQETKPAQKQLETEQKKKVRKVYQIAALTPDENEPNTYWVMQTFVNTTEEYKPGQKEERNGNIDYFFETKEQREKKLQELSKEHKLLYQSYKADTREPDLFDIANLPHRKDEEISDCDSWEQVMEYSAQELADGRKMTVEEAQSKGEEDANNWFRANIGYSNKIEDKITDYTDAVYKAQMKFLQDTNKQKYSKKQLAKVQYFDKNLEDIVQKDTNTCKMWLDKLARDITERYVKPLEKAYNRAKQVIEDKRNEFVEPEKTFELHSTAEHRQAIKEYKIAFVEKIKDMFASTMRFVRESVNYRDNKDRRQERALYLMEANKPDNFRLHMEDKDRQQQKKAEEQAYYKAIQKKFEKEHPKQKKDFGIC